jgi:hypothetical protein
MGIDEAGDSYAARAVYGACGLQSTRHTLANQFDLATFGVDESTVQLSAVSVHGG